MINSSLVERGRSLMDPQPHPLLHFLVQMKQMSTNVFPQVAKNCGSHKGTDLGCMEYVEVFPSQIFEARLAVRGRALSCKRMSPSDSIPGSFDFMAHRSTLSHQQSNYTSLLFFACFHFQCWTNTLYTMLTTKAIKKQVCGPVRFHHAYLLLYRWQYQYVTAVLPVFVRNMF